MKLEPDRCFDCGDCVPICPVDAILLDAGVIDIDQDRCVECGVCWRSQICLTQVFLPEALGWPRVLRALFSDPATVHPKTQLAGRGMEEIKTNDVRNVYSGEVIALSAEIGRPGVGASLRDAQEITRAMARAGATFVADNPLMGLIVDPALGDLDADVLDERVLSVIAECIVPEDRLSQVLTAVTGTASALAKPVLVSVAGARRADGRLAYRPTLDALGLECLPSGKLNLGFLA